MIATLLAAGWQQLRRDRAALLLTFAVPIVFFTIFAVIFGGQRSSETRKVRVLLVDEDGSARAERLAAALAAESALDLRRAPAAKKGEPAPPAYDRARAEQAVRDGDAPIALVIPRGFGEKSFSFGPVPEAEKPGIELLADSSDPIAPQVVSGLLQKAIFTGMPDLFLSGGLQALDQLSAFTPEQHARFDALLGQLQKGTSPGAGGAAPGPAGAAALPIAIHTQDLLGAGKKNPLVAFYAAGLGVMFLLFSAAGAGGALIEERESGTLDRLLSTRVTMGQLLTGKLVYLTSLGVAQLTVMFVWGWLVFGLELPRHLLGFATMAVPTALVSSAFGLVLAAACRTRKQLVALSNLVILSISALGGSMFPRFLMPEGLQKASLVAFNSWALEGFLDVFWREAPWSALLPEIGVLLVWTVALFLVARRVARKWELV